MGGRRQLGLLLGMEMLMQPFWEAHSTTITPALSSTIWNPPSSLLALGTQPHALAGQHQPCVPSSQQCGQLYGKPIPSSSIHTATAQGMASQPTRLGASPTYKLAHSSEPHHNRRVYTAHIGGTPRVYSSGDQRGACYRDP